MSITGIDFALVRKALLNKALVAVPQAVPRKTGTEGKWIKLYPVYAALRRNGFMIRDAVDWLIREGAVPESDRKRAEHGLAMVQSRIKLGHMKDPTADASAPSES